MWLRPFFFFPAGYNGLVDFVNFMRGSQKMKKFGKHEAYFMHENAPLARRPCMYTSGVCRILLAGGGELARIKTEKIITNKNCEIITINKQS